MVSLLSILCSCHTCVHGLHCITAGISIIRNRVLIVKDKTLARHGRQTKNTTGTPRLQTHAIGFFVLYRSHLKPHTYKWDTFITVLPFLQYTLSGTQKWHTSNFPPPENWHHKQRDASPMTAKWYHMIYTRYPREANDIHMRPNVSKGNQRKPNAWSLAQPITAKH